MMKRALLLAVLAYCAPARSIMMPDFYRPAVLTHTPRTPCDWLMTFETNVFGGETSTGFDRCGNHTQSLSIYGRENIKNLAQGVPQSVLDKNPGGFLNTLFDQTTGPDFGTIAWHGTMELVEWNITVWQNLINGFYLQFYAPIRSVKANPTCFTDFSTPQEAGSVDFAEWRTFITNLCQELRPYGIMLNQIDSTGPGDVLFGFGWSACYTDLCWFPYLATDIGIGVLIPASNDYQADHVFNFTRGYGGFIGIPVTFDLAVNLTNRFKAGTHIQGIYFRHKTRCIGLKTAEDQNGFIKLARGLVELDRGAISTLSFYAQADHLCEALSLIIGYSYTRQEETDLRLCRNEEEFDRKIINSDPLYKNWTLHQAHLVAECDTATCQNPWGPTFALSYHIPLTGRRSLAMHLVEGTFNFSASLCF